MRTIAFQLLFGSLLTVQLPLGIAGAEDVWHQEGLRLDKRNVPIGCGTISSSLSPLVMASKSSTNPETYRTWEPIPGVIRDNGVDTFRFEVDTRGPVQAVQVSEPAWLLTSDAPFPQYLRDDGLEGDRIAGDFIFTSRTAFFNTNFQMPPFFHFNTNGPEGLFLVDAGFLYIIELDGTTNEFLIEPSIGLLSTNVPLVQTGALSSNVVLSPHLVNIRTPDRSTQRMMRSLPSTTLLTRTLYQSLPDVFDFLVLFSPDHMERLPRTYGANFAAGVHLWVNINCTGTGLEPGDDSQAFGTQGRLLGINILDSFDRGIYSFNVTHEVLHQWAAYISPTLGLSTGQHYSGKSSAASMLGGSLWIDNHDGTFRRGCDELVEAGRLDKYMMGLIPGSAVGPLYVYNGPGFQPDCHLGVISNYYAVTIQDIQAIHGVRTPLPAQAQREFHVAFVAETFNRWLTPVEITFYDVLAEHYTKAIPSDQPSPNVNSFSWISIDRYFGEGTRWHSKVLDRIRPRIASLQRSRSGVATILATGAKPGIPCSLQASTTLKTWSKVASTNLDTNSTCTFRDTNATAATRFYRLSWP